MDAAVIDKILCFLFAGVWRYRIQETKGIHSSSCTELPLVSMCVDSVYKSRDGALPIC